MSEASFTLFQNTVIGIEIILYACCLKSQRASRQRLQAFLAGGIQSGDDAAAFQTAGVNALAATAYEENISTFSKSVVGNQKK